MSGSVGGALLGTSARTYGRVTDPVSKARFWVQVNPDPQGFTDTIMLSTLIQCIRLNWNESPFYGNWGIPAAQVVQQQVAPDYYMALMQQRFAQYFLALVLTRIPTPDTGIPTYRLDVQFHNGAKISTTVVPQALVDGYGLSLVDGHGYSLSTGALTHGRFVAY